MKVSFLLIILLLASTAAEAQRRGASAARPQRTTAVRAPEIGKNAVVIDETLSVLRDKPSLFGNAIQRMRRGRTVKIMSVAEADGVRFYRVSAPPTNSGWVQADAVFGSFRPDDEERLARLVQASRGFEQVEAATHFFQMYPASRFRPAILLLFGDILEDTAGRLTREATTRLDRREMAASAAPLHSYYLNYVGLDRYRRLGITFVFNSSTLLFHYDGHSWKEIVSKFAGSPEAEEAKKRLESLREKLDRKAK